MNKDLAASLGKAARQARKALGLTQENMAERLDVSVEFYGRIERCIAFPSIRTFVRMVEILGVRADTLLDIHAVRAALAAARMAPTEPQEPPEPPELRHLSSMLHAARPATVHFVHLLLDELERAPAPRKRVHARARGARKSRPAPPDGE